MQYWMALLLPSPTPSPGDHDSQGQLQAIGWWALQFTPRVTLRDEAVLLEIAASQRLFGGEQALRERVRQHALQMGCASVACAPNASAALALARCRSSDGFSRPLQQLLDPLPLHVLTAVGLQSSTLAKLGCRTLGDVRGLPRGGLGRRFGSELLLALDRAYGLVPDAHEWLELPEVFDVEIQLPGRVEVAEGLMFAARRLLTQMAGWLAARHAGVRSFTLRWIYDFHRGRDVPDFDELTIRTAATTRRIDHFARLLGEHLAKTRLGAPVSSIRLRAVDVESLEETSGSLLPDPARDAESTQQLIERLAARLGRDQVVRPVLRPDYRPEHVQTLQPATEPVPRGEPPVLQDLPQPTWLLERPLRLAVRSERPLYQGPLTTVSGPHRVEAGWWDRAGAGHEGALARRDYYVMWSEHAGLLWVYRDHLGVAAAADGALASPWFLQGIFG